MDNREREIRNDTDEDADDLRERDDGDDSRPRRHRNSGEIDWELIRIIEMATD